MRGRIVSSAARAFPVWSALAPAAQASSARLDERIWMAFTGRHSTIELLSFVVLRPRRTLLNAPLLLSPWLLGPWLLCTRLLCTRLLCTRLLHPWLLHAGTLWLPDHSAAGGRRMRLRLAKGNTVTRGLARRHAVDWTTTDDGVVRLRPTNLRGVPQPATGLRCVGRTTAERWVMRYASTERLGVNWSIADDGVVRRPAADRPLMPD
jgi:hypothetical protein